MVITLNKLLSMYIPCRRLFVYLQCHTRPSYPQFVEGRNFNLSPNDQVPHQVWSRGGTWRPIGSTRVLHSDVRNGWPLACTIAEPVEGLEEIFLDNSRPEQMTRISTLANPPVRQALTTFLRENQDVLPRATKTYPRLTLQSWLTSWMYHPLFPLSLRLSM